ncbi:lipopolysaccharide biosynthesis protein [Acinetobacter baylyi]|uniref:lipopolysaccharide biosynthesis protein n=1 Tax=Acinetobacter baylyi TaxID=202950 RepID=UPI0031D2D551
MSLSYGIKWVGLGQFVKVLTQLVVIFYLTRIIPPEEYGLLAMAAIVMNLANIFNDLGTGAAIIQRQNITQEFYNYIYRVNIITGFVVMFFVVIISPVLVHYFQQPELYKIILLFSVCFPISSMSIVHKSSIEKVKNFKVSIKIEVFANLIGLLLAVTLAHLGFGVYSIVFQTIITLLLSTILYIYCSEINVSLKNSTKSENVSGVLSFSGYIFLFNIVNYFSRNLDVIIIGRFFSSAILGAYSVAYKIMLFPVQNLTFVISRVFFPHFSNQLDNVGANRSDYLKSIHIILSIAAPMMLGLSVLSHDLVHLFFDKKWYLIGDLLLWLAPTAIIQSILSTTGTVFTAYAKTFWLFCLGIIGIILMGVSFILGSFYSIKTLTLFYFIANIINFFPVMYMVGKILNFNVATIVFLIIRTVVPAGIMFLGIWLISHKILLEISYLSFALKIVIGIIIYSILFLIFNRNLVNSLLKKEKYIY